MTYDRTQGSCSTGSDVSVAWRVSLLAIPGCIALSGATRRRRKQGARSTVTWVAQSNGPAIASRRRRKRTAWAYNRSMNYQLVIKFWRKSLADEAFLATVEGALRKALGDTIELEGYDVSPKEINLFMLASDPKHAFRRAKDVLEELGVTQGISAAFRVAGGTQFTSVWPLRATRKFKLPDRS